MAQRWTYKDTLKLIELYKSYEFLWNNESRLYKNIAARKQAYAAMVKRINIPGLTEQDIRSKIKNLRSTYYQEIRRKDGKDSKKLVWFEALAPVMNKIYPEKVLEVSESESSENDMEVLEDSYEGEEILPDPGLQTYVVSIKQEYLDEMDNRDNSAVGDYLEPVKKRAKIEEDNENESTTEPVSKNKKVDEFQLFANNIAAQLRKLPLDRALNIQVDVQTMIAKERVELFHREKGLNILEDYHTNKEE